MTRSTPSRRAPTVMHALFGALLAVMALYLVPALALDGQALAAIVAAVAWMGIAALWFLFRSHLRAAAAHARAAGESRELYRTLLEHSGEAHIVIREDGSVAFASPRVQAVLGVDPEHLEGTTAILDLVREHDRRRALHAFATVRRQPGLSVALDVGGWDAEGADCFRDVRVANLSDAAGVRGILVTIRDITPRKTFESTIQHLAYYDPVTGLANRRYFMEQGEKALSLARRRDESAAVLYMDLDRFQHVNDTLGHQVGDETLGRVARSIQKSLRETDVVARMGDDEFAIVLTDVGDVEAAARVAGRILETMPAAAGENGREVAVGASLGVSMFPGDSSDLESLLKAADVAMYRAKSDMTGIQFYRPELRNALDERLRLEEDLRRGLERHEFHLHYQPVFNLITGQMAGAEALSRWRHMARGMVVAADFIELAERSGLIRSLDRWAIARAVQQRQRYQGEGFVGWVAVNLSPQSVADPGLPDYLRQVLRTAGLEPGSLVLEMPEAAVFRDTEAAGDVMWEIRNAGAAIALDDFGSSATSFSRLKRLPIDILKLHPEFVAGIGGEDGDEQLVEAAISIAHGIRAKVLAKGVERPEQVDWLRDSGCDFIQGFLTGGPVPVADLGKSVTAA